MYILVHDYAGHPFQAELSRELARLGHRVVHAFFAGDTGPKGRLSRQLDDPIGLSFAPLGLDIAYSKSSFIKRRFGDLAYGRALSTLVTNIQPEIVISGNTPTEAQKYLIDSCDNIGTPFIYWCQDFYSIAASHILEQKLPGVGHLVGAWYKSMERRQMIKARRIIHITDAFMEQTDRWRIPRNKIDVIPNWGAIHEIPVLPRDTLWAREHGLGAGKRFLYSGTLALKHNPAHLENLAHRLTDPDELVLVSSGVGAENLIRRAPQLPRLRPLPLQPFDRFGEVLASADVLLALIEEEAGRFSVPSKILSYLCAGRPIVLAAPSDNLAAQIIKETGAGTVVDPEDIVGFCDAAISFSMLPEKAEAAGRSGRLYAEQNFDIKRIARRFENIFQEC